MEANLLNWLDWLVLSVTIFFIVAFGVYKTRKMDTGVKDFIKGGNDTKWWTIGLSVMATQASAITFLSTPGQAFHDSYDLGYFLSVKDNYPESRVIVLKGISVKTRISPSIQYHE